MSLIAASCLPLASLIKHVFGLSDTLHPDTYASILKLALFVLVLAAAGMGGGLFLHKLINEIKNSPDTSSHD